MKHWIKRMAGQMGMHLYTDASLPTGVDWLHDIRRSGLVGASPLCFDVGANEGQTVQDLKRAWPAARVHAFEPFSQPCAALQVVAARHAGVNVAAVALGAEPGTVVVQPRATSVLNSLLSSTAPPSSAPAETLSINTVDHYCDAHGIESIDVFKTDTEGYDLEVLRGAEGMLARQRVTFVQVEVSCCPENTHNTAFQPVFDLLARRHRYRFLGLYDTYPLHHFDEPNLFCNALFVSRERRLPRLPGGFMRVLP